MKFFMPSFSLFWYIEVTWYNERPDILTLSIYWNDLILWETSYTGRFNVLRKKSLFFQISAFVINTLNLSIYKVSHCIKSSIYWEIQWQVATKKINIILQKNKQKFFFLNFVILFLTLKSYQTKDKRKLQSYKRRASTHAYEIYLCNQNYILWYKHIQL